MKVAICLSGISQKFEKGYYKLKDHFLNQYDCDIYIHTWDTPDIDFDKILELYQPKDYYFQLPIPFDDTDVKSKHSNTTLNDILSESYSTHASFNLVRDSNIEYDLVVQLKFNVLEYSGVHDKFVVSDQNIAGIYADYFSFILYYTFMDKEYKEWVTETQEEPFDYLNNQNLLNYHLYKNELLIEFPNEYSIPNIVR